MLPAESCCPDCGDSVSYLGADAAEQLELMRSAFLVTRKVREKYACHRCDRIVQAPAPSRPIERGIVDPWLLVGALISKPYTDQEAFSSHVKQKTIASCHLTFYE